MDTEESKDFNPRELARLDFKRNVQFAADANACRAADAVGKTREKAAMPTLRSFDAQHLAFLAGRDAPIEDPEELAEIDKILSIVNRKTKIIARRTNKLEDKIAFQEAAVLINKWRTLINNITATRDIMIKTQNRGILEAAGDIVLEAFEDEKKRAALTPVDAAKKAHLFAGVQEKTEHKTSFKFSVEESTAADGKDIEKQMFEILTNDPAAARSFFEAKNFVKQKQDEPEGEIIDVEPTK